MVSVALLGYIQWSCLWMIRIPREICAMKDNYIVNNTYSTVLGIKRYIWTSIRNNILFLTAATAPAQSFFAASSN